MTTTTMMMTSVACRERFPLLKRQLSCESFACALYMDTQQSQNLKRSYFKSTEQDGASQEDEGG